MVYEFVTPTLKINYNGLLFLNKYNMLLLEFSGRTNL